MEKENQAHNTLRSEQMNELLATPPKWIVNSGGGVLLFSFLLIIGLAWFIHYPDEITGEAIVTTSKAPIELSNQSYVQLKALNVSENQAVNQGELLAQFDFSMHEKDVSKAMNYVKQLEAFKGQFPAKIPAFSQKLQLGNLGEQWTNLISEINQWNSEYALNTEAQELKLIRREIAFREQLQAISGRKIKLSEREYQLMEEQLAGSERLAEQHAVSKQSLNQEKRSGNQLLQTVESQKEQSIHNLIALNGLRKELLRLEHDAALKRLQRSSGIQLLLTGLNNALQNWKKEAVWTAPCSGKVIFNTLLQVNKFYKPDQASMVIVPDGNGYRAIASVVSSGSGKLRKGQQAFIELTDYPKTEFGMLEGRVSGITQMDKDGKLEIQLDLPGQLKTTYGKQIPPKARLKGTAKVITKDKRLLMRFFEQITALIR